MLDSKYNKFEKLVEGAMIESENDKIRASYHNALMKQHRLDKKKKVLWGLGLFLLLGILAGCLVYSIFNFSLSNEDLIKQYALEHKIYIDPQLSQRSTDVLNAEFLELQKLFEEKRYREVIFNLNQLNNTELDHSRYFILAQAYFKNGDYGATIQSLNKIDKNEVLFIEEMDWLMALSLLNLDKEKEASEILTKIVSKKAYKWNESNILLQNITFN